MSEIEQTSTTRDLDPHDWAALALAHAKPGDYVVCPVSEASRLLRLAILEARTHGGETHLIERALVRWPLMLVRHEYLQNVPRLYQFKMRPDSIPAP